MKSLLSFILVCCHTVPLSPCGGRTCGGQRCSDHVFSAPGCDPMCNNTDASVAVDLLVIEFKLKQKMPLQKYPGVRLHIVCFLATVSQYRMNYVADYYLEYL